MDSLTHAPSCDAYPRQGQNPVADIGFTKDIVLVYSVWKALTREEASTSKYVLRSGRWK